METEIVGRVLTEAKVENVTDLVDVRRGLKTADEARSIVVADALVDTGAMMLSLPKSMIGRLGLAQFTTKWIKSSIGPAEVGVYEAVRLTIQGRSCTMDVLEVPDGVPVLIGQLPLESLDFIVDMKNRVLIGNPDHDGEHMYDMY